MHLALDRLAARGRKNIHAILPPTNQNYSQDMERGLREGSQRLGINYHIARNVDSDRSSEKIRHCVTRRLKQTPEIDAVICSSTKAAIAATVAVENQGRNVGIDIDIYGKEVTPILTLFRENVFVEQEDVGNAGDFLAKAVIRQLSDPDLPPLQHLEIPTKAS